MADVIAYLVSLAQVPFSQERLRSDLVRRLVLLWEHVPLSQRVSAGTRERVARAGRLDGIDLDALMIELHRLFRGDDVVRSTLIELDFIVAQLGGISSVLRVGQHVVAALQSRQGSPAPWDDPEQAAQIDRDLEARRSSGVSESDQPGT